MQNLKIAAVALSPTGQNFLSTIIDHGLNGGPRPVVAEFYRNWDILSKWPEHFDAVLDGAHCVLLAPTRVGSKGEGIVRSIEEKVLRGPRPCVMFASPRATAGEHLRSASPLVLRCIIAKADVSRAELLSAFAGFNLHPITDEETDAPAVMKTVCELADRYRTSQQV